MATFFDAATRRVLEARVLTLRPDSPRQWGQMSAHQTVCHLSDTFQMALGERRSAPVASRFKRLTKLIALYAPFRWPRGTLETIPEVKQGAGGTPPNDFERDRAELLAVMARFAATPPGGFAPTHPIFERMTANDWGRWAFRHVDHHLRQFGA